MPRARWTFHSDLRLVILSVTTTRPSNETACLIDSTLVSAVMEAENGVVDPLQADPRTYTHLEERLACLRGFERGNVRISHAQAESVSLSAWITTPLIILPTHPIDILHLATCRCHSGYYYCHNLAITNSVPLPLVALDTPPLHHDHSPYTPLQPPPADQAINHLFERYGPCHSLHHRINKQCRLGDRHTRCRHSDSIIPQRRPRTCL